MMPNICELKQIDGAIWARLDMNWDMEYGMDPVNLYTDAEIEEIKRKERKKIIYIINNIDRVTVRPL